MDLNDKSKNHHFISVCEQKYNSIDPQKKRSKRQIYSFRVKDKSSLILDEPDLVFTEKTLKYQHLYTLKNKDISKNLEVLFKRYEDHYISFMDEFIRKIEFGEYKDGMSQEIIFLFYFKLMNLVRNPYLIKELDELLNFIGPICIDNEERSNQFDELLNNLDNPNLESICNNYNISPDQYKNWLKFQLALLFDLGNKEFLFDKRCGDLFENKEYFLVVEIYKFTNNACLLSDKGYTSTTEHDVDDLKSSKNFSFDFNLTSSCFIRYQFIHISNLLTNPDPYQLKLLLKSESNIENRLQFFVYFDDLDELKSYNRSVIKSCFSNVYQSNQKVFI